MLQVDSEAQTVKQQMKHSHKRSEQRVVRNKDRNSLVIPQIHAAKSIIYKYAHLDDYAFTLKKLHKIKRSRCSTDL